MGSALSPLMKCLSPQPGSFSLPIFSSHFVHQGLEDCFLQPPLPPPELAVSLGVQLLLLLPFLLRAEREGSSREYFL